ncbi:polypeptide N-acetylgalactosaminyltransferase 4 isoform X2 [Aplysia californica]|uniref:Polypeptide N-acetylgalactosaminyltransferase 4 isoform X2 n=1 Tax=Aplysia californica TaxID=6500 RepID=A0ABM1W1U7_APLCA|nr:polypeptide N-acetylgalactosaminyltransferase 4 isoform X2 [Aplysia californica]
MSNRSGLIKARLAGFDHVTGDVAVFLDAHCEVNAGWLEPLLQRVSEDYTVVAVPATDVIGWQDSAYHFEPTQKQLRGGMDWNLIFNWMSMTPPDGRERKTWADPVK